MAKNRGKRKHGLGWQRRLSGAGNVDADTERLNRPDSFQSSTGSSLCCCLILAGENYLRSPVLTSSHNAMITRAIAIMAAAFLITGCGKKTGTTPPAPPPKVQPTPVQKTTTAPAQTATTAPTQNSEISRVHQRRI